MSLRPVGDVPDLVVAIVISLLGGGDGGAVREVLRHPSVEECRLVEIDAIAATAGDNGSISPAGTSTAPSWALAWLTM